MGVIVADADRTSWSVTYIPLTIGPVDSNFNVRNPDSIVITPDLSYAFVSAWGPLDSDLEDTQTIPSRRYPSGSNIGIIRDPFGTESAHRRRDQADPAWLRDVARAFSGRQFPVRQLWRAPTNAVMVFNVTQIIKVINSQPTPGPLPVGPITGFDSAQADQIIEDATDNGGPLNGTPIDDSQDPSQNLAIDIRADYGMIQVPLIDPTTGQPTGQLSDWFLAVPPGSTNPPIATGGLSRAV